MLISQGRNCQTVFQVGCIILRLGCNVFEFQLHQFLVST